MQIEKQNKMADIGSKLRKVRELKNISQEFIANKINLSTKSYSNIENNNTKLTFERLIQICNVMEVDPISVITFDAEKTINNYNNHVGNISGVYNDNTVSASERKQFEERIADLQKEIEYLRNTLIGLLNKD